MAMAVTTDEILARGKGPVQTTWADQASTESLDSALPQTPATAEEPTGVENVATDVKVQPLQTATDVEHTVETVTDKEHVTPVDRQQTAPKKLSYVEMFQQMSPYKPPTPEELEKERKKQKREAIFAAIGEGISAMSNLYFTTQYAPNAFDPSRGMAATTRRRFDQLKKDREDNQRQYMDGFMRAMRLDADEARDERNWRHTLERERIADKRYEIKAAHDKAMADLDEQFRRHQITAAEHKAEQERIASLFAEENEMLRQENLRVGVRQKNAAAGASKASASASYARARYYDNGGSKGRKSGPTLQLEEDEPMRFGDDKDYDRAVMRLAPDYNVPTTIEEVTEWGRTYNSETKTMERAPKKTRTVQRPVKDIAADIEREAAKRKRDVFSQYLVGNALDFSQYEIKK